MAKPSVFKPFLGFYMPQVLSAFQAIYGWEGLFTLPQGFIQFELKPSPSPARR